MYSIFTIVPCAVTWFFYLKNKTKSFVAGMALFSYLIIFGFSLYSSPYAVVVAYILPLMVCLCMLDNTVLTLAFGGIGTVMVLVTLFTTSVSSAENKIKIAAEIMISNYANAAGTSGANMSPDDLDYYSMGIEADPLGYTEQWSLSNYRGKVKDNKEAWDELEKSIIANMADDVTVGIISGKVEIVVKKTF